MVWWNRRSLLRKLGRLKLFIWHLEAVERVDGQDFESCATINEGLGNLHVADDWGAKHREGASGGRALELIHRTEGDGALGPPEQACGFKLGEECVHFRRKLFEDTL